MSKRPELLTASDAEIEDALKYADPMVLRGLLYQLTSRCCSARRPTSSKPIAIGARRTCTWIAGGCTRP
jgi:hypothetical protein